MGGKQVAVSSSAFASGPTVEAWLALPCFALALPCCLLPTAASDTRQLGKAKTELFSKKRQGSKDQDQETRQDKTRSQHKHHTRQQSVRRVSDRRKAVGKEKGRYEEKSKVSRRVERRDGSEK